MNSDNTDCECKVSTGGADMSHKMEAEDGTANHVCKCKAFATGA